MSLSELVTGVTTSQCPPQMMTAVQETGGGVSLTANEQIKSPQEVTLEGDRQPSTVVIVTTKGLTHIG